MRRGDRRGGIIPVVVPFHQRAHQLGHANVAGNGIMDLRHWRDAHGAHNTQVRIKPGQVALQLLQRPASPDLVNVIVSDIGEILFPGGRHIHEHLLIRDPVRVAGDLVKSRTVRLTLVP